MRYIDFHCHLDYEKDRDKRKDILNQCFNGLMEALVTVADPYSSDSVAVTKEIISDVPQASTMIAAHPHEAASYNRDVEERILDLAQSERCIAIGEAGLDFHYNYSEPEVQMKVFKRQIDIAKDLGLPLLIHSRNAEREVLDAIDDRKFENPVVFHCYTGSKESAEEIIDRGYYISFSGIITFKKAADLREVLQSVPVNRIFTETDSPYLAPVPHRGKTNIPPYVKLVADFVAEQKGITVEELNSYIFNNYKTIRDFRG